MISVKSSLRTILIKISKEGYEHKNNKNRRFWKEKKNRRYKRFNTNM